MVEKISTTHDKKTPKFEKPKTSKITFIIEHYAGKVEYTTTGWLDKSKDTLQQDLIELCRGSSNKLLKELFDEESKGTTKNASTASTSVGFQFKKQLDDLMSTLSSTDPNFIRCIKPKYVSKGRFF